ncbi:Fibronectin type III domain-containing protein 5 [Frankliniella fusca]|uniref:Fibronectin type III domain-containing protein 5 n=1 Tax=Frankliniella fusca TaxID=407009 RepID=A0AAE1L7U8_9NEOP|nr:Fibronectin type III domain-containing protein 5 [Frankliniella fusca]
MAPTPPNLNNLTALEAEAGAAAAAHPNGPHRSEHAAHHFGGHHVPPPPGAPAAPAAPAPLPPGPGGGHRARPQQHAERDVYPDTYPGQYEFAVNPPVHRKPPPPVPPYPGTEHLYNTVCVNAQNVHGLCRSYPNEAILGKEGALPAGGLAVPPGLPGSPLGGPPVGPGGPGGPGGAAIVVRAEEALLVLLVLVLWVAAIALFFNRWGKIRMLEPYQPKFQQHRQSCALVDISGTTQVRCAALPADGLGQGLEDLGQGAGDPVVGGSAGGPAGDQDPPSLDSGLDSGLCPHSPASASGPDATVMAQVSSGFRVVPEGDDDGAVLSTSPERLASSRTARSPGLFLQHHRLSKLNLHALGEPVMLTGPPGPAARAQLLRPRQNSVFVGASPAMLTALHNPPRKVKSAMDLQTLVLSEHEPGLGPLGPIGATTSASVLPTCSPSMRRASHVPVGSVPLGAIRHHASFSHASFSEQQPSCSHHRDREHRLELRPPGIGGLPSGLASIPGPSTSASSERAERAAERLASMDRYSHGSNV